MFVVLLTLSALLVAYATGANATFKGVASLLGSGTASYRVTLAWAVATGFAGSLTAVLLAGEMVKKFSGKGLVPDALIAQPSFVLAVALGGAGTVILASWLGFPVSTTHALTGALVGTGLTAHAEGLDFSKLWEGFARPLLLSPVLAIVVSAVLYRVLRTLKLAPDHHTRTLDALHFLSAGATGFARCLNDTPKMVALLLLAGPLGGSTGMILIGITMAIGGWISARQVAETLAHKITGMNPGEGFSANLATSLLVTTASVYALPVSTTQVSVGALLGIGITTRKARWSTAIPVLLSWVITLPCAALLGAITYQTSKQLS